MQLRSVFIVVSSVLIVIFRGAAFAAEPATDGLNISANSFLPLRAHVEGSDQDYSFTFDAAVSNHGSLNFSDRDSSFEFSISPAGADTYILRYSLRRKQAVEKGSLPSVIPRAANGTAVVKRGQKTEVLNGVGFHLAILLQND
jgi:hypothetical protein